MKINPIKPPEIAEKYRKTAPKVTAAPSVTQSRDQLSLTESGKLFASALKEAAAAPEVREDLVSELKSKIESGDYRVDADAIAEKMLQFKIY
ncbi:flagellar biosynthesis anti-sigma factor FlgM [Oscillospiraceae bacterium OttesenSCG-928-G22]|nr:flagellar biosynthesis anti-sigma factor FlgM [Oscillospiraceae bacterium OttesenSCG-928-G22]